MGTITLATDGDGVERLYWLKFIKDEFPSYEAFWLKAVVPLTNRPLDIHFRTDAELKKLGKTDQDISISQLHYSILRHLARVYDILLLKNSIDLDLITEGFARLVGAQDTAFELLEKNANASAYDPWLDRDGKKARQEWQKKEQYPLQKVRNYRNHLIHGRMLPSVVSAAYFLPKTGCEAKYLDWRLLTNTSNHHKIQPNDFASTYQILSAAWNETIRYLEDNWKKNLL